MKTSQGFDFPLVRMLSLVLVAALLAGFATPRHGLAALPDETKAEKDARMKWWRDARFGMFIHWGLYTRPDRQLAGFRGEAGQRHHPGPDPRQQQGQRDNLYNRGPGRGRLGRPGLRRPRQHDYSPQAKFPRRRTSG